MFSTTLGPTPVPVAKSLYEYLLTAGSCSNAKYRPSMGRFSKARKTCACGWVGAMPVEHTSRWVFVTLFAKFDFFHILFLQYSPYSRIRHIEMITRQPLLIADRACNCWLSFISNILAGQITRRVAPSVAPSTGCSIIILILFFRMIIVH